MKISPSCLEKIQQTENELSKKGFVFCWSKTVDRMRFDDHYAFWVNLKTGKSVLLKAHSGDHHSLDRIDLYELKEVKIEDL